MVSVHALCAIIPASQRRLAAGGAFFFALLLCLMKSRAQYTNQGLAMTPPRGWNSYDAYSWIISEEEFLNNAEVVAEKLLPFGYEYVVIDFLWYRRKDPGASVSSPGFDTIDKWGRPIPDPVRWPSSVGGKGFKPVADKVHAMGLKFGIHVMRGISTESIKQNTPILGAKGSPDGSGRPWTATDIALQDHACPWMSGCFVSVNESTEGGQAFIHSLYNLYASWEVDFVKHDCVFGFGDLSVSEITAVSQAITSTGRPMVYSISPGVRATPTMAKQINGFVNMFRITSDDWDTWNDVQLHFDVARDFAAANLIAAPGLNGLSWPDLDMFPLGYLTDPGAIQGPHRFCGLTPDEQKSQVTLWAMAKSPFMFGGDMLNLDQETLELITNPTVLYINAFSVGNIELQGSSASQENLPILGLLECKHAHATRWSIRGSKTGSLDELCWEFSPGTKGSIEVTTEPMGCIKWSPSIFLSSAFHRPNKRRVATDQMKVVGWGSLLNSSSGEVCLDSQGDRVTTFSSFRSKLFTRCSARGSQKWQVNNQGKLISETTKLCAAVAPLGTEITNNSPGGSQGASNRIWLARGLPGEYYVAFFNLGETAINMSVPLASIFHASTAPQQDMSVDGSNIIGLTVKNCSGQEIWSLQKLGILNDTLSAQVSSHGCALFSLRCGE